jgi:hypothetical protein
MRVGGSVGIGLVQMVAEWLKVVDSDLYFLNPNLEPYTPNPESQTPNLKP